MIEATFALAGGILVCMAPGVFVALLVWSCIDRTRLR
jgi:hypothetical protein